MRCGRRSESSSSLTLPTLTAQRLSHRHLNTLEGCLAQVGCVKASSKPLPTGLATSVPLPLCALCRSEASLVYKPISSDQVDTLVSGYIIAVTRFYEPASSSQLRRAIKALVITFPRFVRLTLDLRLRGGGVVERLNEEEGPSPLRAEQGRLLHIRFRARWSAGHTGRKVGLRFGKGGCWCGRGRRSGADGGWIRDCVHWRRG